MGGFGRGGQTQGPLAEAGEYTVVATYGEYSMEHTLEVTRTGNLHGGSSPFETGTLLDFIRWMEKELR
jgi:hypothetical protein